MTIASITGVLPVNREEISFEQALSIVHAHPARMIKFHHPDREENWYDFIVTIAVEHKLYDLPEKELFRVMLRARFASFIREPAVQNDAPYDPKSDPRYDPVTDTWDETDIPEPPTVLEFGASSIGCFEIENRLSGMLEDVPAAPDWIVLPKKEQKWVTVNSIEIRDIDNPSDCVSTEWLHRFVFDACQKFLWEETEEEIEGFSYTDIFYEEDGTWYDDRSDYPTSDDWEYLENDE